MNDLQYLFAGFAVFWAGLTCYLVWLQVRLRTLKRELERLEERGEAPAEPRVAPASRGPAGAVLQPRLSSALAADAEARERP